MKIEKIPYKCDDYRHVFACVNCYGMCAKYLVDGIPYCEDCLGVSEKEFDKLIDKILVDGEKR